MAVEHDGTARVRELLAMDKTSIPPNGGGRFNRLIFEASPYLLQHAENPVAWHPWGEEAFAEARRENKPVFLSIGYATCHWCHVMAHESFEDPDVAAVINRHYVPVKVDREERPDIDDQYMLVAQMMTGSGGWPLNIIMTPEREPFFAITYMPKNPRSGMPGIVEIMENIATLWRTRRDLVVNNCAAVMEGLAQQAVVTGAPGSVDAGGLAAASWEQLKRLYDPEWGGFGGAPKFPMPHFISFLLRHGVRMGDKEPLRMAEHTLDMMRRGGICDQIGFGFHRYAVDRHWLVPHFEKMLYDQALIGDVCLDVFRVTSAPRYLEMAEEILAFVAADLTSPDGGFYAALDADSEGEEGKCYLWTPDEVEALLGDGDAALICRLFDVTAGGNFEGRSILHLRRSVEDVAADEGCAAEDLRARLRRWRETLLAARSGRGQPLRDEKVLTAWNGLMIATLARAYGVTGTAGHLAAATGAADFILRHLVTSEGRLLRSWHSGRTGAPAFLEDYAFLVHGLIALHQATLDGRFLDEALKFAGEMLRLFSDQGGGGLFDVGSDMVPALVRMKGSTDGVVPSGNAVAAMDLLRLGRISGDDELCRRGEEIVAALSGHAARAPANHLQLLVACDYREGEGIEITLEGDRESPGMTAMLRVLHRTYLPGLTIRHANKEGGGMVRAFVCAAGACRPPVMGADALDMLLSDLVQPVEARRRDVARELGR